MSTRQQFLQALKHKNSERIMVKQFSENIQVTSAFSGTMLNSAYFDIADTVREFSILKPWWRDAMLKNEAVPSSKSSSIPSLLLMKSMSAIDAATVPAIGTDQSNKKCKPQRGK
jgi:hypothetical protein